VEIINSNDGSKVIVFVTGWLRWVDLSQVKINQRF